MQVRLAFAEQNARERQSTAAAATATSQQQQLHDNLSRQSEWTADNPALSSPQSTFSRPSTSGPLIESPTLVSPSIPQAVDAPHQSDQQDASRTLTHQVTFNDSEEARFFLEIYSIFLANNLVRMCHLFHIMVIAFSFCGLFGNLK